MKRKRNAFEGQKINSYMFEAKIIFGDFREMETEMTANYTKAVERAQEKVAA